MFDWLTGKKRDVQGGINKRQYKRMPCNEHSSFNTAKGEKWGCKILDTSMGGMCILSDAVLNIADTVKFITPQLNARVVWVNNYKAGLEFA